MAPSPPESPAVGWRRRPSLALLEGLDAAATKGLIAAAKMSQELSRSAPSSARKARNAAKTPPSKSKPPSRSSPTRSARSPDPNQASPLRLETLSDAALRKALDAFYTEGSCSTEEMTAIIKKLKLPLSSTKIKQLLTTFDPGSGEIDPEEFKAFLRKQRNDDTMEGHVVGEASSIVGWLQPLAWVGLAGDAPAEAVAVVSPSRRYAASSPTKSSSRRTVRKEAAAASIPKMKWTQYAIGEAKHQTAQQMRTEAAVARDHANEQQQRFLQGQHAKVLKGHLQAVERVEALEELQRNKRFEGLQMRSQLEHKISRAQRKQREWVESSHAAVYNARKKKQGAVKARLQEERVQAVATVEAAKIARAQRKEQTKATVRRQEQAAREYTAKVRYETRPEVRQESSAHFEAQRKAVARQQRQRAEHAKQAVATKRQEYLDAANKMRSHVGELHAHARSSREHLHEIRRQDADRVRARLDAERHRKAELEASHQQTTRALHQEIRSWKEKSTVPEQEAVKSSWGWW